MWTSWKKIVGNETGFSTTVHAIHCFSTKKLWKVKTVLCNAKSLKLVRLVFHEEKWKNGTIQNVYKLEKKLLATKLVFLQPYTLFTALWKSCEKWKQFCVMLKVSHFVRLVFHEEKSKNDITSLQSHEKPFLMEGRTWFFTKRKKGCP